MLAELCERFPVAEALFSPWGDYDRKQFEQDCAHHRLTYPFAAHWNIKQAFSTAMKTTRGYGIGKALKRVGLSFDGTLHRGLDDVRNIVRLLPYILTRC